MKTAKNLRSQRNWLTKTKERKDLIQQEYKHKHVAEISDHEMKNEELNSIDNRNAHRQHILERKITTLGPLREEFLLKSCNGDGQ